MKLYEQYPERVTMPDGREYALDLDFKTVLRALDVQTEDCWTPLEKLELIADDIEQELQGKLDREISTVEIGEMVMKRLKEVDEVAYVRFASVYRSFKDINTFMEELSKLLTETK